LVSTKQLDPAEYKWLLRLISNAAGPSAPQRFL
jgi:hypothetical protein